MTKDTKEQKPCPRCEHGDAQEPHACPFAAEIHNDSESLCECCESCEHECAMDI